MADRIYEFVAHVLELMFFTGLIDCVLTIIVSWVEICSDAFSDDDE
jgi:hypothetical protein